jgi:hypothetical protein
MMRKKWVITLLIWLIGSVNTFIFGYQSSGIQELTLRGLNYTTDLAADSEYLYVVDALNKQINKYDYQGQEAGEFGGEGKGPGEFLKLNNIDLCGSRLYALEPTAYKVVVFDVQSGAVNHEFTLDDVPMRSPVDLRCGGDALTVSYDHSFIQGKLDMNRTKLVVHVNEQGAITDTVATLDAEEYLINKMEGGFGVQPMPFRRNGLYAINGDYFIYNNNREPILEICDTTGHQLDSRQITGQPSDITLGMRTHETNIFHVLKRSIAQSDQEMHDRLPYTDAIILDGDRYFVQRNWKSKQNTIYMGNVTKGGLENVISLDKNYRLYDLTPTYFIVAELGFSPSRVRIIPR